MNSSKTLLSMDNIFKNNKKVKFYDNDDILHIEKFTNFFF